MTNIFKPNSRFAALADEIQEPKKDKRVQDKKNKETATTNSNSNENNIFKRAPASDNRYNSFLNDRNNSFSNFRPKSFDNKNKELNEKREKEEKIRREKEAEEKKQKALAPENFPDIIVNTTNTANNEKQICMNFSEKLKSAKKGNETEKKEVDLDYENLKPGWALTKRDPLTKKLTTIYKESLAPKPREKTQQEIGIDIINALVELHNKRTEEYIEMWGYETWEKMYRFPNYDYEYFDKLDELYEEMENESSAESGYDEY